MSFFLRWRIKFWKSKLFYFIDSILFHHGMFVWAFNYSWSHLSWFYSCLMMSSCVRLITFCYIFYFSRSINFRYNIKKTLNKFINRSTWNARSKTVTTTTTKSAAIATLSPQFLDCDEAYSLRPSVHPFDWAFLFLTISFFVSCIYCFFR